MLISIVTPSFNQAAFLPRTLDSIASQSYESYEHLVYDPGSTDGSSALLRAYADRNPRARVMFEPDRGQVHAINKGLAQARGDILTWLNSDDYYYDGDALAAIAEYFTAHPEVDVAYGRGLRVDAQGRTISQAFVHPAGTDFTQSLQHSIGLLQPALFFRRAVFEKVGGLDEAYPLQLDYELWIRFAQAGFRFGFVDKLLCKATVHDEAKSTHQRQKQLNECLALVRERFGYVPSDWIERYAEFYLTQRDRKVERDIRLTQTQQAERRAIERALIGHCNGGPRARQMLASPTQSSPQARTMSKMHELGLDERRPRRVVITSFDSQYFQQGLNLIASLHRTSLHGIDQIYVFPLGLTDLERQRLTQLERVDLVDYPDDLAEQTFPEFLSPKTRAYKAYAMRSSTSFVRPGDLVLWMDAGLSALKDIGEVFDLVAEHDFFMPDHDDVPSWPIFNVSFIHAECLKIVQPSNAELMSPHLCSCLVGYRAGGRHQEIIDQAWEIGRAREAVLWPKNLKASEKFTPKLGVEDERLRDGLLAGHIDPSSITQSKLLSLFPYHGHRTQSVLSILVRRHGAPSFSGTIYRQSNKASSTAASVNWQASAKETDRTASRSQLDGVTPATVIYQHRGVYHHLDGLRFRGTRPELFVMGNGPSLRGFDFERLKQYDSLGMNAAYRFWDTTGFYPTYYACFDTVVQESHQAEIRRLIAERGKNGIRHFFLRDTILKQYPELADEASVFLLEQLQKDIGWFGRDKITTGSFSALVGLFMGYRRIYLLGIDLNYVEKLPEARVEGRALEIVEDPVSNPNYFFDGYQLKGDRYNPPNRHPDMHLRSWRQLKESLARFPAEIVNLNPQSAVKDFRFEDFSRVDSELRNRFRGAQMLAESAVQAHRENAFWRQELLALLNSERPLVGPHDREAHAHVDETKCVSELPETNKPAGFMIDVGAHHGSALLPFARKGWNVLAFEPDEVNRQRLREVLAERGVTAKVTIDFRAASNEASANRPFFRSDQSTGISGLSAFHPSHIAKQTVDTVTLREVLQDKPVAVVDFLKIDTEGFDLFVLEGFPWERLQPRIVECEFEDAKTRPLGYDFHRLASFLVEKGYSVFVSEWHPIVRYGVRHDWKRLLRYPCELSDPSGWGNLLAFHGEVDEAALVRAFESALRPRQKPPAVALPAPMAPDTSGTPIAAVQAPLRHRVTVSASPCFTAAGSNTWAIRPPRDGEERLWTARLDLKDFDFPRRYAGGITLRANRPIELKVTFGRQGKSEYEGVSQRLQLVPGETQRVQLAHTFRKPHAALKMQVEALGPCSDEATELVVDAVYMFESAASIRQRLKADAYNLRTANTLFRNGDLSAALLIYLSLYQSQPCDIYAWNASLTAARLSAGTPSTIRDLVNFVKA